MACLNLSLAEAAFSQKTWTKRSRRIALATRAIAGTAWKRVELGPARPCSPAWGPMDVSS
eukprot:2471951-Lingulodinium_polyedra.AAC.1